MRVRRGLIVLALVTLAGFLGYWALGLEPLPALYQAVITLSTVGFGELDRVDTSFQVFTIVFVVVGTGAALFTIGMLFEELIESGLTDHIRRQRMHNRVDKLRDHVVVCGWGQVGRAISSELHDAGRAVVVIDRNEGVEDAEEMWVVGDATEDEVLRAAGIERAAVLVVAMDSDADNVYVTLTGRTVRPELEIVARASSPEAVPKLLRAGADHVVNPHQIGGRHMASLIIDLDITQP